MALLKDFAAEQSASEHGAGGPGRLYYSLDGRGPVTAKEWDALPDGSSTTSL